MRILLLASAVLLTAIPLNRAKPLNISESLLEPESETADYSEEGNAWEKSGFFEGDIVLPDARNGMICHGNGCRWAGRTVPYRIEGHYDGGQQNAIKAAMDEYHRRTCIRFRPANNGDRNSVLFLDNGRGCSAAVGRQNGVQHISLARARPGQGCLHHGTIVHEILHALGFWHQHSASDRDRFVRIHWENVQKGQEHNFNKYGSNQVTDFGIPYDYGSIMHYGPTAFSKNGKPTISPTQNGAHIGQNGGLSGRDIQKLHKMYGC